MLISIKHFILFKSFKIKIIIAKKHFKNCKIKKYDKALTFQQEILQLKK